MARIDLSDLQRTELPRERLRRWFEDLLVLTGLAGVAWFIGDSVLALMSKGGWLAALTAIALTLMAFLWFWWSAWSRRAKLFCAVVFALILVTSFVHHYAQASTL